jgi:phage terminase large subunit-like protein
MHWLVRAGRGFGKTRLAAEWVRQEKNNIGRIAIIAESAADGRDYIVDGESGILACSPPWDYPEYTPSSRRITWANGAYATLYSGDKPDQIRGGNFGAAWIDELAKMRYCDDVWRQLKFALRTRGSKVRVLITTTPRAIPIMRTIENHPKTVTTTGTTFDNAENLSEEFIADMLGDASSLGRQELYGEYIDAAEGALWTRETIESTRVLDDRREYRLTVIGIDPATVMKRNATGIVAVSKGIDGHGYVRGDSTCKGTPAEWARRACDLYEALDADIMVAEGNQGGEMVRQTIHSHNPNIPVKIVHARQGKQARAEPIAAFWEQSRMHMVGNFGLLEDQMVTWEPESGQESPDRIDAMVWAARYVFLGPRRVAAPLGPVSVQIR